MNALHRREQKNHPVLLRQFLHRLFQMRLELARGRLVFRRRPRRRLRPERLAHFPPFRGSCAVNRETKCDAHEPATKARTIAQMLEKPVSAQPSFLGDVLRIRAVAQGAARDAVRQRAALREALLELLPFGGFGSFARQVRLPVLGDRDSASAASWLDQNQLLHWVAYASRKRSPSPYTCQTARLGIWFISQAS